MSNLIFCLVFGQLESTKLQISSWFITNACNPQNSKTEAEFVQCSERGIRGISVFPNPELTCYRAIFMSLF